MTVDLQQAARDHLWLHFTRMGGYRDAEIPVIVSGDGCYLTDSNGKRYLDALAGLFSVNIGYGFGDEVGQAAHHRAVFRGAAGGRVDRAVLGDEAVIGAVQFVPGLVALRLGPVRVLRAQNADWPGRGAR